MSVKTNCPFCLQPLPNKDPLADLTVGQAVEVSATLYNESPTFKEGHVGIISGFLDRPDRPVVVQFDLPFIDAYGTTWKRKGNEGTLAAFFDHDELRAPR